MLKRLVKALSNRVFHKREIEMMLKHASFEDNTLNFAVSHPQIQVIAHALGEYFLETGANNYMEMTMFDPATIGIFTLTMQKEGGMSPGQVNKKLRAALEAIHIAERGSQAIATEVLKEVGYLP